MLSYNQTIEKMKGIKEKLKTLETKTDIYKHKKILREYHKNGNTESIKRVEADFLKDTEKEQNLKHHLKVYSFNAEKLCILENIPIIIEVLNGYTGKKCGEKTYNKIKEELYNKTGFHIYFGKDNINIQYGIYGMNTAKIYAKYIDGEQQRIIDEDNKINNISEAIFHLPKTEDIIDDVEEYTAAKEAEFLKLKDMYAALEEAIIKYNENCPFKHQYIREGIYWMD